MRLSRLGLTGCVTILVLAVSACGFTPMHGTRGIAQGLSDIRVATGEERADFYVQEALLDAMGARNAAGPMRLVAQTDVSSRALGVGADATFTRREVIVSVSYRLYDGAAPEPIVIGLVSGSATFDSDQSIYAELVAERTAEERAAGIAADRLVLRLVRELGG